MHIYFKSLYPCQNIWIIELEKMSSKLESIEIKGDYIEQGSIYDTDTGLEKRFSLWSTIAFQFSLICSSIAIGTYLNTVVGVGGSPFLIYGYILAVGCDLVICFSLAELASAYPHSSAQVHWTYCLAPKRFKKVMSFLVGILSCAGWIFACFAVSYTTSMFIIALAEVYNPGYVPQNWHYYLIYVSLTTVGWAINVFGIALLPIINYVLVFVINGGTLFIVVTLLVKSNPKRSIEYVFLKIQNDTGWSSNGLVFFLGLLPSIATVTFFDGAAHMTNEIPEPERNIPLVMIIANSFSAIAAFLAAIAYMYCIVNPDHMASPIGGQPIIQLMYDAFHSKVLTTIGILILIITFWGSYIGYACSGSRLVWSFANAGGLPFGKSYFGKINTHLKVPVNSLNFITIITLVLGLIIFGSSTALSAVLGSSMVCINLSYVFPVVCMLWKSKFSLSPYERFKTSDDDELGAKLTIGKNLPYFCLGKLGLIMNIIAACWTFFIIIWLNFPIYYPVKTDNMNYACVVLGITFIIAVLLWFFHARRTYDHDVNSTHI